MKASDPNPHRAIGIGSFPRAVPLLTSIAFWLSERPCGRCLKRNIGHLCHDEPREPKKPKQEVLQGDCHEEAKIPMLNPSHKPSINDISAPVDPAQAPLAPPPMPPPRKVGPAILAPSPVSMAPRQALSSSSQGCKYSHPSYNLGSCF